MNGIIELEAWQVLVSYLFALVVLWFANKRGIRREKAIFLSCVRMTVQLVLVGHVLAWIFDNPSPLITVLIIILMECFAVYTVFRKFPGKLSGKLKGAISFSMGAGTLSCLLFFLFVVVRIIPWYDPRYFIPIAGMLVGNSMTGISLGVKSLVEGMTTQKHLVEEALVLGATVRAATKNIVDSTFDAAIMPTINAMIGMGIVFLPGMMTGQILSGVSPDIAVAYQVAIMLGILGSVALTVIILLNLGCRTFFNERDQFA